jgi:heptosyltransferase-2
MTPDPIFLVVAPNWLGDAVMALPAIGDVRRRVPEARLIVAARKGVADLVRLSPLVDEVVQLGWGGQVWKRAALAADVTRLRDSGAQTAILLPNSFASAYLVYQAGIAERWGYATDLRRHLLTKPVARPRRASHQAEYYQQLMAALGMETGPLEPELTVSPSALAAARTLLAEHGFDGRTPMVVLAPGAAYGRAKQWVPSHVTRVIATLAGERATTCVLVGSHADAGITAAIRTAVIGVRPRSGSGSDPRTPSARVIDLAGKTTLEQLAAILSISQACIANDSGAMHVAAAVGAPVVAIFGPTIVEATRPLPRRGGRVEVLTNPVWCRPCMLRECPIDHRCMTGITPERVLSTLEAMQ